MEKGKVKLTQKDAENTPAGGVVVGKRDGQTMIYDDASLGGYFVGKLHKDGGIKMVNKSTGQPLEVQGSEIIITAPAVADTTKREFEGKMMTNREILSKINSDGGGVSFADGGDIPAKIHTTDCEYKFGGKVVKDTDIAHSLGMNSTLKKGKQQFSSGDTTYDVDAIYNAIKKGKLRLKTKEVETFPMKYPVYDKNYAENHKIDFRKPNGITVRTESGEEVLIDGNHRMNNAYSKGRKTMKTYYIEDLKQITKFTKKNKFELGGSITIKKDPIELIGSKVKIDYKGGIYGDKNIDKKYLKTLKGTNSERKQFGKITGVKRIGNNNKPNIYDDFLFEVTFDDGQKDDFRIKEIEFYDQNNNYLNSSFSSVKLYADGGHLSSGKSLKQIAQMHNVSLTHINEELAKGLEVEKEHFTDFKERTRVAKDHLVENPNYYTILAKAGLKRGGKIGKEDLVEDAKNGNTPARDLNNYNDVMDLEADGAVGGDSGLAFADGGITPVDANLEGDSVSILNTGGGLGLPKVAYVKVSNAGSSLYNRLVGNKYDSYIEFAESVKDAYKQLGKTIRSFVELEAFNKNDEKLLNANTDISNQKNTVKNFNPLTGNYKNLEKSLQNSRPISFKKYDWEDWLLSKVNTLSSVSQSTNNTNTSLKSNQSDNDVFGITISYKINGVEKEVPNINEESLLNALKEINEKERVFGVKLKLFNLTKLLNEDLIFFTEQPLVLRDINIKTISNSEFRDFLSKVLYPQYNFEFFFKERKSTTQQYPEYYEYVKTNNSSFTKGKIYKIRNPKNIEAYENFIDNDGEPNGFSGENTQYFKASTEEAFLAQQLGSSKANDNKIKSFKIIVSGFEDVEVNNINQLFLALEERKNHISTILLKYKNPQGENKQFGAYFRENPDEYYELRRDGFNIDYLKDKLNEEDWFQNQISDEFFNSGSQKTTTTKTDVVDKIEVGYKSTAYGYGSENIYSPEKLVKFLRDLYNGEYEDISLQPKGNKFDASPKSIDIKKINFRTFLFKKDDLAEAELMAFIQSEMFPKLDFSEFINKKSTSNTPKPLITDLTATKIKIIDPEMSKKVQQRAFELGWKWVGGSKEVSNTSIKYLFFYADRDITQSNSDDVFDSSNFREIFADDFFASTSSKTPVSTSAISLDKEVQSVLIKYENGNEYTALNEESLLSMMQDIWDSNGKTVRTIKIQPQGRISSLSVFKIIDLVENPVNIEYEINPDKITLNELRDKLSKGKQWYDDLDWSDFFKNQNQTSAQTTNIRGSLGSVEEIKDLKEAVGVLEGISLQASQKYNTKKYEENLELLKEVKEEYALALSFTPESSFMYERIELMKKIAEIQKEITTITELKNGGAYYILSKVIDRLDRGENWKELGKGEIMVNEVPQQEIESVIHTEKFKNWFGDWEQALITKKYDYVSKAITKSGKPCVMYHGAKRIKYSYRQVSNGVVYLAENRSYAEWFSETDSPYQKQGDYLTQCFVNLKNPIDLTPFGVEEVDLRDIIQFIDALYPLAKIYDVLPPNTAMAIMNNQLIGRNFRAWYIIRQFPELNKHIRDNTTYDGFIYYENNPSDMIPSESGEMVENITKATAVFNSNQVKLVDAMLFDGSLDDWRFETGGKVN